MVARNVQLNVRLIDFMVGSLHKSNIMFTGELKCRFHKMSPSDRWYIHVKHL